MQTSSVAKDYAKLFFEVCEENDIVDEILYELNIIKKINNLEVSKVINNPIINNDVKKDIITSLKTIGYKDEIINLMKILIDNEKMDHFLDILVEYENIYQEKKDITIVRVKSAKYLSENAIEKIRISMEKTLNQFVIVINDIEESLIGGVIISYNDKEIDNSIKTNLKKISRIRLG